MENDTCGFDELPMLTLWNIFSRKNEISGRKKLSSFIVNSVIFF